MVGLAWEMTATLAVEKEGNGVRLHLEGEGLRLSALADFARIHKVSAYANDPGSACP